MNPSYPKISRTHPDERELFGIKSKLGPTALITSLNKFAGILSRAEEGLIYDTISVTVWGKKSAQSDSTN